jgi:hypothetical protein
MEATTVNLKTEALKNGVIWGVISIVIFLITWYVMPDLMASYLYAGITAVIGIALAVFFCIDMRKKAGGYWSFSEALWNIFVMFLVSVLIVYTFTILFGKYVDTTYPVKMKEITMEKTADTMKSLGMDDDALAKAMTDTSERLDKQFTPTFMQAIVGFGIASVFYFIGALIFAAIFKRKNPNPYNLDLNETANP